MTILPLAKYPMWEGSFKNGHHTLLIKAINQNLPDVYHQKIDKLIRSYPISGVIQKGGKEWIINT